ncbi:MAG TPA: T9SS type A sorting domain-containing protein, partial [Bacteroidia bacterium]|nr:T9SS type A sorting domain-containing protein [Bacteroidia bacterium]
FIVKYDFSGNAIWAQSEGGSGDDLVRTLTLDPFGSIIVAGRFSSPSMPFGSIILTNSGNLQDMFIAKLNNSTSLEETISPLSFVIAPNPFTTQTKIMFDMEQVKTVMKIIDVVGNVIKVVNVACKQLIIEKGEMEAGIYFLQVIDKNQNVITRKIVVQ